MKLKFGKFEIDIPYESLQIILVTVVFIIAMVAIIKGSK